MYNTQEILKKAELLYTKGELFRALIEQREITPIEIKLAKIKEVDIQKNYAALRQSLQTLQNSSLPLSYQEFSFKTLGVQKLPVKVEFTSLKAYLHAIDKTQEYQRFQTLYSIIIARYENLKSFFLQKPFLVLEYSDVWSEILEVVSFLLQNKEPNIYTRQLQIQGVDTKFIEKYKKIIDTLLSFLLEQEPLRSLANYAFEKRYGLCYQEPLIRFRILDQKLYLSNLRDISLPLNEFCTLTLDCKYVFIVENKITALSFGDLQDSLVIFGSGYGVVALKNIALLKNKEIYYWGDIDLDGFAILSQLRSYYPQTQSIMMDRKTLQNFSDLALGVVQKKIPTPLHLTQEEQELFAFIVEREKEGCFLRLEQERLCFGYCTEVLQSVITSKNEKHTF